MVVEAAPVVPRQVEHARLPLRAPHQGVDDLGHPGLARPDVARRMLARADERHDPGHRRERPRRRGLEVVGVGPDVAELMVLLHGAEPRDRELIGRGVAALPRRAREADAGLLTHVVGPGHTVLVEQVRDVGPCVRGGVAAVGPPSVAGVVQVRRTAHRVMEIRTIRRPGGGQEQVRGQRPRVARREHPVLQDELIRIGPVVRDLGAGVEPHDVGLARRTALGLSTRADVRMTLARVAAPAHGLDEAVHLTPVNVAHRCGVIVGAPRVEVRRRVIRARASLEDGIRETDVPPAVGPRDAVGARIRPEVVVERAVLLHDDDDVIDRLDAGRRRGRRCGRWGPLGRSDTDPGHDRGDRDREHGRASEEPAASRAGAHGPHPTETTSVAWEIRRRSIGARASARTRTVSRAAPGLAIARSAKGGCYTSGRPAADGPIV